MSYLYCEILLGQTSLSEKPFKSTVILWLSVHIPLIPLILTDIFMDIDIYHTSPARHTLLEIRA